MERLIDIKPAVENKIRQLRALASGFEKGQIFLTALELGVFSTLRTPLSAEAFAGKLGAKVTLAGRFLDVLAGMNLLEKTGDQYCTAPDMAPFLVESSPFFAHYLMWDAKFRDVWIRFKEILLNEQASPTEVHERGSRFDARRIDWMANESLLGRLQGVVGRVKQLPEFAHAGKLIDLGGGHGLFGIAFAQENPHLDVVVFDRPEVTPLTQGYIERYGMSGRVRTLSGDYTTDALEDGFDIVFEACSFCGDDQDSRSYYRRICGMLKDNGLFVRLTFTLDDNRTGPLLSVVWDLRDHLSGHEKLPMRTNSELFRLLSEGGLSCEQVIDMSGCCSIPMRLIVSRKAAVHRQSSSGPHPAK